VSNFTLSKSRIFLFLLISFIFGVFWGSFFQSSENSFFVLILFALLLIIILYKNPIATLVAFLLLFFVLGSWCIHQRLSEVESMAQLGESINHEGIVQTVSQTSFGQNVVVQFKKGTRDDMNKDILVLLQLPLYPEYSYGDVVIVTCNLKAIENKDSKFDYQMYMAKEGVLYQGEKPTVAKLSGNKGNWIYRKIILSREIFENKIDGIIPQPYAALAKGLLFGGSDGLSTELQNDFAKTGMTHIVAVSGYNVTIIAEYLIFLGIALGLWRRQAIVFAVLGISMFVLSSGLPASAVRAGIMSSIMLWSMRNGRLATSENAIVLAGAIMLLINPLLLRWDIGFQLSFLATIGIVSFSNFWQNSFVKKNMAMGISEIIVLSLSAQLFVLPIIVYNFHIVSLISLLANVLILPIIPVSMLLVFFVCLFGVIFSPLAVIFGWLAFILLYYEIRIVQLLANIPWASIEIKKNSVWCILLYYGMLIGVMYYFKKYSCKEKEK
jgi:competence protein ComEC